MTTSRIRCAIYTRKSSEEGLDQSFNSLDAQHEACAAYIASQRHEGWKMLPARFDDGGLSGGTLERPALRRLLAEIEAGRVDMVVVYKIDRLTRSLADFAKLVERLEAKHCSFVSVTQAFNTSSSMGRLTLNVLLSFAQFEREVTAERIRDKIAASKKKGLWMGGLPPLGYDPHPDPARRQLVVNETEAAVVRQLFELYLEHGCLNATARAAAERGLRSKRRVFASGRVQGGGPFSRGHVHRILTNPVYRGVVRYQDKDWPGTQPAIIDACLWSRVQDRLQSASAKRRGVTSASSPASDPNPAAPLLGKIRDETGDLLTPTHTRRHGRRIRYYVSNGLVTGKRRGEGWRLPAPELERAVAAIVADHLEALARRHAVRKIGTAADCAAASERALAFVEKIRTRGVGAAIPTVKLGTIAPGRLRLELEPTALARTLHLDKEDLDPAILEIDAPFTCRRRGVETRIVAGEAKAAPDPAMLRALQNAHRWAGMMKTGTPLRTIASRDGVSEGYVARIIPLASLSPTLQEAIVTGMQPVELNLRKLVRKAIPLDWEAQERLFRPRG